MASAEPHGSLAAKSLKSAGYSGEPQDLPFPPIRRYIDLTINHLTWALEHLSEASQQRLLTKLGWDGRNRLRVWLFALKLLEVEQETILLKSEELPLEHIVRVRMIKYGIFRNHRTRHLTGLSLRNLSLAPQPEPALGGATDDDSIDDTFRLAMDLVGPEPGRSESIPDLLKRVTSEAAAAAAAKAPTRGAASRRRSTLSWANEPPAARMMHLKNATSNRRLDVFVSIHTEPDAQPFYVTETQYQTMNVDFNRFDLSEFQQISRRERLILKVWVKGEQNLSFIHLLEVDVHLGTLTCVGRSMEDLNVPVMDNTVFFHFTDGTFTDSASLACMQIRPASFPMPRMENNRPEATSTFDALLQLRNITECIKDAQKTREIVASQIDDIFTKNRAPATTTTNAQKAKAELEATHSALNEAKRKNARLNALLDTMKNEIKDRREALGFGRQFLEVAQTKTEDDKAYKSHLRAQREENNAALSGQIRRIATQYLDIFPIEPISDYPLCFTIGGLYLPNAATFNAQNQSNSKLPPANEDETAAALGKVAHIVDSLATKLFVPLPYIIAYQGSTSSVFDPISPVSALSGPSAKRLPPNAPPTPQNSAWRVFFLNQKMSNSARFSWGVYLLNKCIEEVMSAMKLKMVDPRHTLANLKYLITVLSSGKGTTPGRRVGTIRGLSNYEMGIASDSDDNVERAAEDLSGMKVSRGEGELEPELGLKVKGRHPAAKLPTEFQEDESWFAGDDDLPATKIMPISKGKSRA